MARERRRTRRESLDGFLFNVEKFFGSVACQRMSFSEKGVYLVMLFQEWRAGSVPDDAQVAADLIAVTDSQVAEVVAAWPVVRRKFVTDERDPNWMTNVALENTRRDQRRYLNDRAKAGRLGGEAKSRNQRRANTLLPVAQLPSGVAELHHNVAEPWHNIGIRSDLIGSDQKGDDQKKESSPEARRARSVPLPLSPTVLLFPTIGPIHEWPLTEAQLAEWAELYPGMDVAAEARQALAWVKASGTHRKTARGMPHFLVNWLNRSVKAGGTRRGPTTEVVGKQTSRLAQAVANIKREASS